MIKLIGLIDFDVSSGGKYKYPNYDLGVTYRYLSADPNVEVRLVGILSEKNLLKYDEIYVFKRAPYRGHPLYKIPNYYKLNVKEFGQGFTNRPARPFIKETWSLRPDFSCYNKMIKFSTDNPHHYMAWRLDKATKTTHKDHIKLYDKLENEYLRKDFPGKAKRLIVYDDLNALVNNINQFETLMQLLDKGYQIKYAQELDISKVTNTNIIERIASDDRLAAMRKVIIASEENESFRQYVQLVITNEKRSDIFVILRPGMNQSYYMHEMLRMLDIYYKTKTTVSICPIWIMGDLPYLAHSLYEFLYKKPKVSFYEYVFFRQMQIAGVPKGSFRRDEALHGQLLEQYGMSDSLYYLEDWLRRNPQFKECVFKGGLKYERQRKQAYDKRRSKFAFDTRSNGIS